MRPLFSASSAARCVDCKPNGSHRRIVVALVVLGLTAAAILLWRTFSTHTGDPLIAAMLVAVVFVTVIAPATNLLKT